MREMLWITVQSKIHSVENQIKNLMSCCMDLLYLLCYQYDLHCGISGYWSGEVSLFVPPYRLFLNYVNQTAKKQFIKVLLNRHFPSSVMKSFSVHENEAQGDKTAQLIS